MISELRHIMICFTVEYPAKEMIIRVKTTIKSPISKIGLKLGVTLEVRKNYLPINFYKDALHLGRFAICGDEKIKAQCKLIHSDIGILSMYRQLKTFRYVQKIRSIRK